MPVTETSVQVTPVIPEPPQVIIEPAATVVVTEVPVVVIPEPPPMTPVVVEPVIEETVTPVQVSAPQPPLPPRVDAPVPPPLPPVVTVNSDSSSLSSELLEGSKRLKSAPVIERPVVQDSHSSLLDQIRQGTQLKKANTGELPSMFIYS